MPKTKPKDNVTFVKDLMSYGSPLRQVFVIEAISKYAAACAKADPETFDSAFLSGQAWVQVAKDINAEMTERYK